MCAKTHQNDVTGESCATKLFYILLDVPLAAVALSIVIRIIRYFYKFPMPEFLANAIDNPLRRKIQPPTEMPHRHLVEPGMTVLEVGPGNGRYTVGTLAFSEMVSDPDYPLAQTLIRMACRTKFQLKKKVGNFFAYTLVFEKQNAV